MSQIDPDNLDHLVKLVKFSEKMKFGDFLKFCVWNFVKVGDFFEILQFIFFILILLGCYAILGGQQPLDF